MHMRRFFLGIALLALPIFHLLGQVQSPNGAPPLQVGEFGIPQDGPASGPHLIFGIHGTQGQATTAQLLFAPALPAATWALSFRSSNRMVYLSWLTPASFAGGQVVVESSKDGVVYAEVAWENALPGQRGEAKLVQDYHIARYYRLKVPFYHRAAAYSNVVCVRTSKSAAIERMQMVIEPSLNLFRFVRADGVRGVEKDLSLETRASRLAAFEERQGVVNRDR